MQVYVRTPRQNEFAKSGLRAAVEVACDASGPQPAGARQGVTSHRRRESSWRRARGESAGTGIELDRPAGSGWWPPARSDARTPVRVGEPNASCTHARTADTVVAAGSPRWWGKLVQAMIWSPRKRDATRRDATRDPVWPAVPRSLGGGVCGGCDDALNAIMRRPPGPGAECRLSDDGGGRRGSEKATRHCPDDFCPALLPYWDDVDGAAPRQMGNAKTCCMSWFSWLVTLIVLLHSGPCCRPYVRSRAQQCSVPPRQLAAPTDETRRCTASGVTTCREAGTEAHARGAESRERVFRILLWRERKKKKVPFTSSSSCRFPLLLVYKE